MPSIKEKINTPKASTKLSLLSNILLFVLKFYGGFFGGSRALIADCINSLLDIIANSAVWIGLNLAKKPADEDHQYGHGNADVLAASFVALIILVTGFYIGYDSIHVIVDGRYGVPSYVATGIAFFTIVFKSVLFRYTKNVGVRFKSAAVLANAYDHKSDVYASAGAFFGIIVSQMGYPILDPIGGLWVSFFILRNAINLIRDNIHTLMSGVPDIEMVERVTQTVDNIKEVKGVNTTRIRTLGSRHFVDLEIFIEKDLSVLEGHNIAHKVRDILVAKYDDISDVMIHVEPFMEKQG
jgi:cation diffusion facilitator family transporter